MPPKNFVIQVHSYESKETTIVKENKLDYISSSNDTELSKSNRTFSGLKAQHKFSRMQISNIPAKFQSITNHRVSVERKLILQRWEHQYIVSHSLVHEQLKLWYHQVKQDQKKQGKKIVLDKLIGNSKEQQNWLLRMRRGRRKIGHNYLYKIKILVKIL